MNDREEIKKKISDLKTLYSQLNSEQMSIKNVINSIYGVFLNRYFYFYNLDIGRSITLTGQDITKFTGSIIDHYFIKKWHTDYKLHQAMGLTKVEPVTKSVWVYSDTDSAFTTFEDIYNRCEGWQGTKVDFILAIYNYRLKKYFEKCFVKYLSRYGEGVSNYLNLEPEKIAGSAIWFKKKMYVLNIVWKMGKGGGINYKNLSKIDTKGLTVVKSTTPPFIRTKFMEVIIRIFQEGRELNMLSLMQMISKIKNEFFLLNVEDACGTVKVNNYSKYVIDDTKDMVFAKKTPSHLKGAAYYNHLLKKNSKYKDKYTFIKDSDKVKFYDIGDDNDTESVQCFAFIPGEFPYEFAPTLDYEKQFSKYFIKPFNSILSSIGRGKISSNLIMENSLF